MIDVMMFLLVFFVLISINVLPALGLNVIVPAASRAERVNPPSKITITVEQTGGLFVDGGSVDLVSLPDRIRTISGDGKPTIIIAGDARAEWQRLVDVLDALKVAGIANAALITKSR